MRSASSAGPSGVAPAERPESPSRLPFGDHDDELHLARKLLHLWLKDAAVRSAVNHILDSKKLEVPADLEWDRLPDFHAAVLAAHQARCDYATALHGLWSRGVAAGP